MRFALRESVQWVARQSPRVAQLRTDRGTRGAEAESKITLSVHGYTAHPTPGGVRLVSALLVNRDRARSHIAQLKPSYPSHAVRAHSIGADNRFVGAEVAVGNAEHEPIADAVEFIGGGDAHFGNAGTSSGTKRGESCRWRSGKGGKSGVRRCREIRVEMISGVIRATRLPGEADESGGRARGRQSGTIQIGREKRIDRTAQRADWTDESGGLTDEHLCAIEGKRLRPEIRGAGGIKDVHAHVIAVRPDAQVRVIVKVRTEVKPVARVGAGRVGGGRDSDAFVGDRSTSGRRRKLADEPAIGEMIVEHHGIAGAAGFARAAEASPDAGDGCGRQQGSAGRFVEDLVAFVYDLNKLRGSDRAICIGRSAVAAHAGKCDAVKIQNRGRNIRRIGGERIQGGRAAHVTVLDHRVRAILVAIGNLRVLIGFSFRLISIGNLLWWQAAHGH